MEADPMLPQAYAAPVPDPVRERLEVPWTAQLARRVLLGTRGRRVLELGCGAGVGAALAEQMDLDYTGLDFRAPGFALPGPLVEHDLGAGLGPVGHAPFDLYLAGFGLVSHLAPGELARLLGDVARHAAPGSMVVLEALGLFSLEWPRLWSTRPGAERALPYAMAYEVEVHPWAPRELADLARRAGLRPVGVRDRTVQAGPKSDDYWPGLPDVRGALRSLLDRCEPGPSLTAALPPLPAGPAAAHHQRMAAARRRIAGAAGGTALAERVWRLEQGSGGGFGHGLMLLARVP